MNKTSNVDITKLPGILYTYKMYEMGTLKKSVPLNSHRTDNRQGNSNFHMSDFMDI